MKLTKTSASILIITIVCCGLMMAVDGIIQPGYAVKSAVKILLFLGLPLICARFDRQIKIKSLFKADKKIWLPLLLGLALYGVIIGGYFAVKPFYDFSGIADNLSATAGVTKDNFLYVSIYISFVNSLLEEFFFRGFVFVNLKAQTTRIFAYIISSAAFALYHVTMMTGWFNIFLFLLVVVGLGAGGVIFNYLNEKRESIYTSWFVHMFANFAINTIGFMLLK